MALLHTAQSLGAPSSQASNRAELPGRGAVVGRRSFVRESRLNAKGERVTGTSYGCTSKACLARWLEAQSRGVLAQITDSARGE